ncbi:MAG: hypothetical protein Kow0029_25460 [Candidatus Rifleibacteriota bacterium]
MIKKAFVSTIILTILSFVLNISGMAAAQTHHNHETHASCDQDHEGHEGHNHEHEAHSVSEKDHDEHEGHDHNHDLIMLSPEQLKYSGIKIETAGPGNILKEITLTGEVSLNQDTLIHHVSRAPGIIAHLYASVGDYVRKGDILAIVDSAELGQAKSEFYEIFNEVGCCNIDLKRFKEVAGNTGKLLAKLEQMPEIESLQKTHYGDMSDYGARLLKTYTEFMISSKTFQRKGNLYKEKIISENDYLAAQNAYEKALADYCAARDNSRFEIKQKLFDFEKLLKVNEFKLRSAERKLKLLGLSSEEIEEIRAHGAEIQNICVDPVCKECRINPNSSSWHETDNSFSQLAIKSARSGTVTYRDASLGEEVEKNKVLFTVADTSALWAILQAPARDYPLIKQGMEAIIQSADGIETYGRVILVNPVIDEKTRTVGVRVALNNDSGRWLPGSFVTGKIKIAADNLPVVIDRRAVQTIEGSNIVFVLAGKGFKAQKVKTGKEDSRNVEIISGLKAGDRYVSEGSFTLKSIKVTSGMDAHAGHNH